MKSRVGNIECLRFLFAVCIVLHHAMIGRFPMWGGFLSVEFFYILSGAFMGKSIRKKEESANTYSMREACIESSQYCWRRIKGIMPYFFVSTIIGTFILGVTYDWRFNLENIFECGQCFRWERISDTNYVIIAYRRVIEVIQNGSTVTIINTNMKDFNEIWKNYFDLNVDYEKIKEELSKDELLRKSVEFGYGIRILNQDPFEMLISFIISARNSIPSIMKTIKKISEKWGDKIEYNGNVYYAFPTPEQLKEATLDEIKETGASFRSKYIVDTIAKVNAANEAKRNGTLNDELQQFDLEYIKSLPVDECHKALQNFMGVGAKVADCIMLFSMSKHSAFPVDVWIKRAMIHFYLAPDVSLNKIRVFGREKFGELAGLAQQYLFYYARENNIKVE